MKDCLITFRSVTPAQRGEQLLQKEGIRCSLRRTPRWMEEQGCGYSLHIRCADALAAIQLLRKNKIPYRKSYLRRDDGKTEEMLV